MLVSGKVTLNVSVTLFVGVTVGVAVFVGVTVGVAVAVGDSGTAAAAEAMSPLARATTASRAATYIVRWCRRITLLLLLLWNFLVRELEKRSESVRECISR